MNNTYFHNSIAVGRGRDQCMRLFEQNKLRESEGQQVLRSLDGIKPAVRDGIGVQVVLSLSEARNLALKAETNLLAKSRSEAPRRNIGASNYQATWEKPKATAETSATRNCKLDEDKTAGKQKEKEAAGKEVQKNPNPYARSFPTKCFKCNQPGHRSSDCPLRKGIHMVERDEEEREDATYCEADGGDDEYDDDDDGQTYVTQRLMLAPKQEDESQRVSYSGLDV